ncbi:hypothetical protein [Singulisphaera sp. PoT]|uniref:hypothetical protein n=1 Tax=Singulisphaera sp. PoT TaxID=3411797 RepID=UPI003BF598AA
MDLLKRKRDLWEIARSLDGEEAICLIFESLQFCITFDQISLPAAIELIARAEMTEHLQIEEQIYQPHRTG